MKKITSNIIGTVLITLSLFSAIAYTSCNKSKDCNITCQNGGNCNGNSCTCLTGFSGTNCEIAAWELDTAVYTFAETRHDNHGNQTGQSFATTITPTSNAGEIAISNFRATYGNVLANVSGSSFTFNTTDTFNVIGNVGSIQFVSGGGSVGTDGNITGTYIANTLTAGIATSDTVTFTMVK